MILIAIYIYCGSILGFWAVGLLLGSSLEVVSRSRNNRNLPKRSRTKILVIVNALASDRQLLDCLHSLNPDRRKILEIIVLSTDPKSTKKFVQSGLKLKLIQQIKYIPCTHHKGLDDGLNSVLSHGEGKAVLMLNASNRLDAKALRAACSYLGGANEPEIVYFTEKVVTDNKAMGWFEALDQRLNTYCNKSRCYYGLANLSGLSSPLLIKGEAITKIRRKRLTRVRGGYGDRVITYQSAIGLSSYVRDRLSLCQATLSMRLGSLKIHDSSRIRKASIYIANILALAKLLATSGALFLIGYFAYLAVGLKEPQLLLISWATFGVIYTHAVFLSEGCTTLDKLSCFLLLPAYTLWLIFRLVLDLVGVFLALVRLIRYRLAMLASVSEVELVTNQV